MCRSFTYPSIHLAVCLFSHVCIFKPALVKRRNPVCFLPSSERLRALQGMSLETGPAAVFCPSVITAHTLHLKTFGKSLQVETLQDTPVRMSKLLETRPPPTAPFPLGCITHQTIYYLHRHHGPITLRRLKCFGNEPTYISFQIHAASQLPQTHSHINHALQKSPQTQTHAYHAQLSHLQNMLCTVSHRQLQSIRPPYPMKYPLPLPAY